MNKIHPKKLLNSKWTAVTPTNKEKHFLVSDVVFGEEGDEKGLIVSCSIEAVMSKRVIPINWKELEDDNNWLHGWK